MEKIDLSNSKLMCERYVKLINKTKKMIQAKKEAGIDNNGWTDECAERDVYSMQQKVNKLAGIAIY